MDERPLFCRGAFRLSSGVESNFLIDCRALSSDDLDAIAFKASQTMGSFSEVVGIPRGGLPLAEAFRCYCSLGGSRRLVVDDVWTTGSSMLKYRREGDLAFVIFSRAPNPPWWLHVFFKAGVEL